MRTTGWLLATAFVLTSGLATTTAQTTTVTDQSTTLTTAQS